MRTIKDCSTGTWYLNSAHVKRGASRQATPVAIRMTDMVLMTVCVVEDSCFVDESLFDLRVDPRRGSVELWSDVEAMLT
jgi:hypothetical protein